MDSKPSNILCGTSWLKRNLDEESYRDPKTKTSTISERESKMINDQSKSHEVNMKGWERSVGVELKTYLRVLLRHKRVIALCTVVALGLTILLSSFVTPLYAATAKLRVASAPGAEAEDA
jgi:hypothetical protein